MFYVERRTTGRSYLDLIRESIYSYKKVSTVKQVLLFWSWLISKVILHPRSWTHLISVRNYLIMRIKIGDANQLFTKSDTMRDTLTEKLRRFNGSFNKETYFIDNSWEWTISEPWESTLDPCCDAVNYSISASDIKRILFFWIWVKNEEPWEYVMTYRHIYKVLPKGAFIFRKWFEE